MSRPRHPFRARLRYRDHLNILIIVISLAYVLIPTALNIARAVPVCILEAGTACPLALASTGRLATVQRAGHDLSACRPIAIFKHKNPL